MGVSSRTTATILVVLSFCLQVYTFEPNTLNQENAEYTAGTDFTWTNTTVDSAVDVGSHTSLTVDSNGDVHISYFDEHNEHLKYATYDGSSWSIETVDSGEGTHSDGSDGKVGKYSSIAVDSNDVVHISYYQEGNQYGDEYGELKYASGSYESWSISEVSTGSGWPPSDRGKYSSIAIDSNNNPHISYFDATEGNLGYRHHNGVEWDDFPSCCTSSDVHGLYTSIDLDSNNYPHISYYDATNGDLKYAVQKSSNSWWANMLVDGADDIGYHSSLIIDSNQDVHISYQGDDGDLKYATRPADAASEIPWTTSYLTSTGSDPQSTSIAVDSSGNVHISYYESFDFQGLKYATYDGNSWTTTEVDGGDAQVGPTNVGFDSSLALDSSGGVHISYYDFTNGNLKYATPSSDNFNPIPSFSIIDRLEYRGQIEVHEDSPKNDSSGNSWAINLIRLGPTGDLTVHFDASNSSDGDATDGTNGIKTYIWKVFLDNPYDQPGTAPQSGKITEVSSMVSHSFTHRFQNVTVDPTTEFEGSLIRVELTVIDQADKPSLQSDKYKMYFVVVGEGYGDDEPVVDFTSPVASSSQTDDTLYVNGSITSGSENGDVMIEVALEEDTLDLLPSQKFPLKTAGEYDSTVQLADGAEFSLALDIADLYDENGSTQTIWIKITEGDGSRWTIYQSMNINLTPLNPPVDTDDDGVDDSLDQCQGYDDNIDVDGDGTPDGCDDLIDSDGDGVGDNVDVFPDDPTETHDTDGDGYGDEVDAFPTRITQWTDYDGDGYGDNFANSSWDSGLARVLLGPGEYVPLAFKQDACPLLAGTSYLGTLSNGEGIVIYGCPDSDGDGVADIIESEDQSINEPGEGNVDVASPSGINLDLVGIILSLILPAIAILLGWYYSTRKRRKLENLIDVMGAIDNPLDLTTWFDLTSSDAILNGEINHAQLELLRTHYRRHHDRLISMKNTAEEILPENK